MSLWCRELPVYSPLTSSALVAGLQAWRRREGAARARVRDLVREAYGKPLVTLVDSGTSALALAMRAAVASRPGRTCIALPAYACPDLLTAIEASGATAILYDVDPASLGPDLADLTRVMQAAPVAAVVVAHLYGVPVDVVEVRSVALAHGAVVIEDAAQGVGGALDGRRLGAHGDLSILSFGRGKGRTGGEGGALLLHEHSMDATLLGLTSALPEAARSLQPVLASGAQWMLGRPHAYGLVAALAGQRLGSTIYHPPGTMRLFAPVAAAVLESTWFDADEAPRDRRQQGRTIQAALRNDARWRVPESAAGVRAEPGWLRLPMVARQGAPPLAPALGIVPGYPRTLAEWPESPASRAAVRDLPGAAELARALFTVPVHSQVTARGRRQILAHLQSES